MYRAEAPDYKSALHSHRVLVSHETIRDPRSTKVFSQHFITAYVLRSHDQKFSFTNISVSQHLFLRGEIVLYILLYKYCRQQAYHLRDFWLFGFLASALALFSFLFCSLGSEELGV